MKYVVEVSVFTNFNNILYSTDIYISRMKYVVEVSAYKQVTVMHKANKLWHMVWLDHCLSHNSDTRFGFDLMTPFDLTSTITPTVNIWIQSLMDPLISLL